MVLRTGGLHFDWERWGLGYSAIFICGGINYVYGFCRILECGFGGIYVMKSFVKKRRLNSEND